MKHLPIGKQEFLQLIEGNFVYVDKTTHLIRLASTSVPRFLSRPRRFGKSLTISTLKELFFGSRELFKNTFAFDNWDFNQTYPVISLDLSTVTGETKKEISRKLLRVVQKAAIQHGVNLPENGDAADAFEDLIITLGQSSKVVVLVDEYDAPILDNLKNENLLEIKKTLRAFFKILKANEVYGEKGYRCGYAREFFDASRIPDN